MYTFRIYLESDVIPALRGDVSMGRLPTKVERIEQAAKPIISTYGIMWTEAQASPFRPSQLIINTKPARHVYDKPELVFIEGQVFAVTGLVTGGSGVLRATDKHFILISPDTP